MANPSDPAPAASTPEIPVAKIEHDNSQLEDFLEANKSKLLLGLGAILVSVIGYLVISFKRESGISAAAAALTGASSVEELQKVVSEFPDDNVAGTAELLIAEKLKAEGKADESYEALKTFEANRKGHPLYLKGVSDLGLREHVRGNLEEAVKWLKQAATSEDGFIEQPALLRLGDALTAQGIAALNGGDAAKATSFFDEALKTFESLSTKADENSTFQRMADQRIERLPHLSIKPLTPEAAKAAAAELAAPEIPELVVPEETTTEIEVPAEEASPE